MELNPYVTFDGTCADAMALYGRVFDTAPTMVQTFAEMPGVDVGASDGARIGHARLKIGDVWLMMSDSFPGTPVSYGGVTLQVSPSNVDQGRAVFDQLADGGAVTMPFAETFWAKGFGMLTDRFGVPWMINVEA